MASERRPDRQKRLTLPKRASLATIGRRQLSSRFIAVGALFLFTIPSAYAQPLKYDFKCGDYPEVMRAIEGYNEQLIGTGITDRGNIIQQFRSRHGDFTIIVVYPNMRACIAENGTQWQAKFPFSDAV